MYALRTLLFGMVVKPPEDKLFQKASLKANSYLKNLIQVIHIIDIKYLQSMVF